jgi:hypothetical protein
VAWRDVVVSCFRCLFCSFLHTGHTYTGYTHGTPALATSADVVRVIIIVIVIVVIDIIVWLQLHAALYLPRDDFVHHLPANHWHVALIKATLCRLEM